MTHTKQITEFTFWDFCLSTQAAIKEGFEFSSDNANFPVSSLGLYTAVMVKTEVEQVQEPIVVTVLEPVTQTETTEVSAIGSNRGKPKKK